MFEIVTDSNIEAAAQIHADAWRQSHKSFCSEQFVKLHTAQRQMEYIRQEMKRGRMFYLLRTDTPKGIVSVCGSLIENLYVAPDEQRKGYGRMLLALAESLCADVPVLWVLSNNAAACSLYQKCGYSLTGNRRKLREDLYELEMTKAYSDK